MGRGRCEWFYVLRKSILLYTEAIKCRKRIMSYYLVHMPVCWAGLPERLQTSFQWLTPWQMLSLSTSQSIFSLYRCKWRYHKSISTPNLQPAAVLRRPSYWQESGALNVFLKCCQFVSSDSQWLSWCLPNPCHRHAVLWAWRPPSFLRTHYSLSMHNDVINRCHLNCRHQSLELAV